MLALRVLCPLGSLEEVAVKHGNPGRYVVKEVIGRGGSAVVHRALDALLDRWVALKVFPPSAQEASLREARTAVRVRHANVVGVHDAGWIGGHSYIAMELVDGQPLRRARVDPAVTNASRLQWIHDVGAALAAVHGAGVLHLDVKPGNVLVDRSTGAAKLLDFGIAQIVGSVAAPIRAGLGTPRYVAPEHIFDGMVDARSDQWAWGVLGYELLTGFHPMDACGAPDLFHFHDRSVLRPAASLAPVPESVSSVLARALSREPCARFASMAAAVRAFEGALRECGHAWRPSEVALAPLASDVELEEPTTTRSPIPVRVRALSERLPASDSGGWPELVRRHAERTA